MCGARVNMLNSAAKPICPIVDDSSLLEWRSSDCEDDALEGFDGIGSGCLPYAILEHALDKRILASIWELLRVDLLEVFPGGVIHHGEIRAYNEPVPEITQEFVSIVLGEIEHPVQRERGGFDGSCHIHENSKAVLC